MSSYFLDNNKMTRLCNVEFDSCDKEFIEMITLGRGMSFMVIKNLFTIEAIREDEHWVG